MQNKQLVIMNRFLKQKHLGETHVNIHIGSEYVNNNHSSQEINVNGNYDSQFND